MFKVFALIAAGIFLVSVGNYFLSVANLPAFVLPLFDIHFPDVNWGAVGFVVIAGGLVSIGSAFVAVKLVR
jgi:hypothetical protein